MTYPQYHYGGRRGNKRDFYSQKYHPLSKVLIERANHCLEEKQFAEMCVSEAFYIVITEKRARFHQERQTINHETAQQCWRVSRERFGRF